MSVKQNKEHLVNRWILKG